ncbi:glycosyltransferase [Lelliottia wanjuensis]|uniref:glycosyltransferase n=1 Tax=Lelliottia wanjuensis TaxID=3050585 RepID=UPI00254F30ED|nr:MULTISPECIES: glycosyltransferase family 2 protein [unclassified Lelliottia]MDK9356976.1 glycosyltransferase family 2 protein [Lelliottia sp. V106_16]MDK9372352.1 glycosyltransferase family 2 protein [Lelliottia sp. V106_10]MDK9585683.1 glycosyltransferase family 2 protein [Lelliottia sp. V86_10]MDK9599156.1 glycosyltransferase family 2 protein [Lelliottia sp. V106_5]
MNDIRTLIVLLNWNGSLDTLDCCESLNQIHRVSQGSTDVLIVDNNSTEQSLKELRDGLELKFGHAHQYEISSYLKEEYSLYEILSYGKFSLFCSRINHGFSRGCNIGARYALEQNYEYILFLNNDTIVEPNFLEPLFNSVENSDAVIPQIRYHHDKNLIWNCGGSISKFGSRKYNYAKQNIRNITFPANIFPVSFATGCCILFRTKYFNEIGLFSEKFFFGEEDIELALRLLKRKAKVLCNIDSIIYHKVGASLQGNPEKLLRKAYIHYLNRFVNMKMHLGKLWYLWLIPSTLKVFLNLLVINKATISTSIIFIKALLLDSFSLWEVNKDKFESILKCGIKK